MSIKIKPITKAELRRYVQAYRGLFSGWTEVRGEGFVRISGPIAQQVWFENLRSGAYRPATAISILVAKGASLMHQFLDVRHREVLPREHDAEFEGVCNAMREQFVPSIISPLDANEVCRLCEERAGERLNDAHSLAALNAYLGNIDSAKKWIETLKRLMKDRSDLEEWEKDRVNAANALQQAIENGNVRSLLDEIRLSEESRLLRA